MSSRAELVQEAAPPSSALGHARLMAASSFAEDPLPLPFDLQRSPMFHVAVAAVAIAAVAGAMTLRPIAGLAIVLGIGFALAVAMHPRIGLYVLAGVVPVTSGFARGMPIPGFRVAEVLIGVVASVLLVSARRTVGWTSLDWLALVYALATFGLGFYDLVQRATPVTRTDLDVLAGPLQFLLLYRAIAVTATTGEARRQAVRLLLLGSVPVSLLTIGQQLGVPGVRSFIVTITHNNIYATGGGAARATGPFPHWHNVGGYLFLVLLLTVALLVRKVPDVLPRWALLVISLLGVTALVQTLDIAPTLGLVAGSLLIGAWLGGLSRVLPALAVGALLVMLLFSPEINARYSEQFTRSPGSARSKYVPQTIQHRLDIWTQDLFPLLKGRWTTGYGPDLPPQLAQFPHTESLYIGLLFRGGVILLISWIALMAAMALAAIRSIRHPDPFQQALGATVASALLMLVFIHFIAAYFLDDGPPQVLWLMAGLLAFREVGARVPVPAQRGSRLALPQERRSAPSWGM
jgi:hypothetical protein